MCLKCGKSRHSDDENTTGATVGTGGGSISEQYRSGPGMELPDWSERATESSPPRPKKTKLGKGRATEAVSGESSGSAGLTKEEIYGETSREKRFTWGRPNPQGHKAAYAPSDIAIAGDDDRTVTGLPAILPGTQYGADPARNSDEESITSNKAQYGVGRREKPVYQMPEERRVRFTGTGGSEIAEASTGRGTKTDKRIQKEQPFEDRLRQLDKETEDMPWKAPEPSTPKRKERSRSHGGTPSTPRTPQKGGTSRKSRKREESPTPKQKLKRNETGASERSDRG